MISCAEAVHQLWEYLDTTLDPIDRAAIDAHLTRCRRCCGELEFAEELRRKLDVARDEDLPSDTLRRLTQSLEEIERWPGT